MKNRLIAATLVVPVPVMTATAIAQAAVKPNEALAIHRTASLLPGSGMV